MWRGLFEFRRGQRKEKLAAETQRRRASLFGGNSTRYSAPSARGKFNSKKKNATSMLMWRSDCVCSASLSLCGKLFFSLLSLPSPILARDETSSLCSRLTPELREDVAHMDAHGFLRNSECRSDFAIRSPVSNFAQYSLFSRRQASRLTTLGCFPRRPRSYSSTPEDSPHHFALTR